MKYTLFSSLSLLLLLVVFGCTKTVDADKLLDSEEKVLIVGFLSPSDTLLRVNVTKALPSIGTVLPNTDIESLQEQFRIPDALVTLSDAAGNTTVLEFSEENQAYLAEPASLPILNGATYFLTVSVGGNDFTASCRIPERIAEITHRAVYRIDEFGTRYADISLAFDDFKNEENFYILGGLIKSTFTFEGEVPQTFEGDLFFDTDRFLTDNIEDGGTLSGQSEVFIGNNVDNDSTSVLLKVGHVEEILFQEMRTLNLNTEAGDGNPFVEYSITPNNILSEGAIGIFAGYQITEKEIILDVPEDF